MDAIKEGLLKVDPGLLLWTVITFAVLLLILWKAAWKPIVRALDSRAEKVRNDIETADRTRQKAEKVLEDNNAILGAAKGEADAIISRAREEAERIKAEILEKAGAESRALSEKVKRELQIAKENALQEIRKDIVVISTEVASRIIRKNLNPDDQKGLVEEAVSKIGAFRQ